MNVIAWLEFEQAYYDVAIQHITYYAMGIPISDLCFLYFLLIKSLHSNL